jgi:hypothetical protein
MSDDLDRPPQPASFKGKWLIIVLVPAILIVSAWLIYLRLTFKKPVDSVPLPTGNQAPLTTNLKP